LLFGGVLLIGPGRALAINTVSDYQKSPAFVTSPVQPLTMLMLDNSGSMGFDAYSGTYDATRNYYGLFETRTTSASAADIYYYHPFNIAGSGDVCNYDGISGSCNKPDLTATGECTYPERTCTTGAVGDYVCFQAGSDSGTYTSDNCNDDCSGNTNCSEYQYTCQSGYVTSGSKYDKKCSDVSCSSGYSCTEAYYCSGNTSVIYAEDACDADGSGTSDCSGGASNCKPFTYSSGSKNSKTCVKYSLSGTYDNNTCDSQCSSSACQAKNYTCKGLDRSTGITYSNSTCDGSDGNTTTDCSSGYSCVNASKCVKQGSTTRYYGSSSCEDYYDTDDDKTRSCSGTCSSTGGGGSVVTWTGQACASCTALGGVCNNTGSLYAIPNYNCVADSTVCDSFKLADSVCTPTGGTVTTCDWVDLEQKATCQAICGGILVDVPTGPQQAGCTTATEKSDCVTKYGSVCETGITYTTARASYWRKTPADGTNPLGWNCNTGDCLGAGANVTLGNQLNFDQMTQMDVAKKVLIGGKRTTVSSIPGTVELDGDFNQTSNKYICSTNGLIYNSRSDCRDASGCDSSTCTPFSEGGNNGNIVLQPGEDPKGILQNNEGLAWGFGVFNSPDGGIIKNYIGSPNADIVKSINDTPSSGATPVAESLNTVVNYFRQVTPYYKNPGEYTVDTPSSGTGLWDPFVADDGSKSFAPCGRASTILITDGEPNQDDKFDATIKNYANNNSSGITDFISPTSGTNTYFVDDVAYWAHKNDLRTEAQMGGPQTLDTYMIYAFGNDPASKLKLQNAAVLGAFIDKNGDGKPNSKAVEKLAAADAREWDFYVDPATPGDDIPDNYAEANDGELLASKLQNMLGQIQQKVSAGSAASVISASRSGEGAIYQAIFYPKTPPDDAYRKITWVGDVHALWLDDYGNMREDCDADDTGDACVASDATLNVKTDKIIEFYSDTTTGEAMIRTFRDLNGDSKYISGVCSVALVKNGANVAANATSYEVREFDCTSKGGIWNSLASPDYIATGTMKDFSHYLWSGGRWLANADAATQRVYTTAAKQRHILTMEKISAGFYDDMYPFTTTSIQSFYSATGYKNIFNAASQAEADNIVNYIRGVDIAGYRSRLYDWGWGDGAQVNKLGDIVGSTPTIVAKPAEDYDVVYADKSYQRFRQAYESRRVMVYAGGNDGGLHAFNGGYYQRSNKKFLNGPPGKVQYDLGSEMWMFVPRNILPHLKWLTDPNYSHIYYLDMKPYVFDAKIFDPDATHPDGWGTVLVGGMGFGGGDFTVDTDGDGVKETTLRSTYFILDVTNPERPPVLLKEFNDAQLGFTLGAPNAVPMLRCDRRVHGSCPDNSSAAATWPMDWYLAFGSGPHNDSVTNPAGIQNAMLGKSDQEAKLYMLNLGGTGAPALARAAGPSLSWVPPYTTPGYPKTISAATFPKSFFSDLIAVDYDLNFKTDVMYFGSIADTQSSPIVYKGGMHRLVTAESLTPSTWTLNTMFNAGRPVSASATASWDGSRAWVYFGTGRLLNAFEDKADTSQQSYYGLTENHVYDGVSKKYKMDLSLPNGGNLVNVSNVWVNTSRVDSVTGLTVLGSLYDTVTNNPAVLTTTAGLYSPLAAKTFKELDLEIGETDGVNGPYKYNGWKINFPRTKERNLGQAALLGSILTFTTYMPSSDICTAEGESIIWAPYYRTGTAYFKPVLGMADRGGKLEAVRETTPVKGMTLTPSLHSGAESGTKALIQTSTGAIISVDQEAPGTVKSGVISWRDKAAE
jgi:type IV pilus assembly protein PilY1